MPVGSGTVGLLPMKGYPSPALGAPAEAAGGAAKPTAGCSGNPKCGACWGARLGGVRASPCGGRDGRSAPAVGGGAESGGRPP